MGLILAFSGVFNIDSVYALVAQSIVALSIIAIVYTSDDEESLRSLVVGLSLGLFIGITLVAMGVLHGVYP